MAKNRRKTVTQDGRDLWRYRKHWKVERLSAWLQNFWSLVVRYEYHPENFLAMVQLGPFVILLRRGFRWLLYCPRNRLLYCVAYFSFYSFQQTPNTETVKVFFRFYFCNGSVYACQSLMRKPKTRVSHPEINRYDFIGASGIFCLKML